MTEAIGQESTSDVRENGTVTEKNTRGVVFGASCLAAVAGLVLAVSAGSEIQTTSWFPSGLAVVVGFVLASLFPVSFERGGQHHTYSLSNAVLAIALPTVGPVVAFGARVVAEVLMAHKRGMLVKVVANVGVGAAELAVAGAIFVSIWDGGSSYNLWIAVAAAAMISDMVGYISITRLLSIYSRENWQPFTAAQMGVAAAPLDAGLGVALLLLWRVDHLAVVLLSGVPITMLVAYRAHAELADRHRRLTIVHNFSEQMTASVREDDFARHLLRSVQEVLSASASWICVSETAGPVLLHSSDDVFRDAEDRPFELAVHRHALESQQATVIDADHPFATATNDGRQLRDILSTPLAGVGFDATLSIARTSQSATWEASDIALFETLASSAAVALQNGTLVEQLRNEAAVNEHISLHDSLTGLPNRRSFERDLAAAVSRGAPFAVILLDLDRFKDVNDTLGHDLGDQLLCEIASRCRAVVRQDDVVARLGGDEFAMLLRRVDDDAAAATANDVVRRLHAPVDLGAITLNVSASVGLTQFPQDGDTPSVLLQRADVAMYTAKASLGSVEFYDPARDEHTTEKLTLVSDLRSALAAGLVTLAWQPQIDLATQSVIGVEALARWVHPERGNVSPVDFVAVAERTGVITELTRYVLERAVAQAARWVEMGHGFRVSVNLSARNLTEPDLVPFVEDLLDQYGLSPRYLSVEITETAAMSDPDATAATLAALAELGLEISVDDFGTGHSSLVYLQQLPLAEVKIDRAFVKDMRTDPGSASIVRAILGLGRELGLLTVAEGVEDAETAAALAEAGCSIGQGYFWAQPMTAEEFGDWLSETAHNGTTQAGNSPA